MTRRATDPQKPVVGHGRLKKPTAWRAVLTLIASVLAVVLVSTVSVAAYTAYDLTARIKDNSVQLDDPISELPPSVGAIEGGFNIMVVGVDNDEDQSSGYGDRDATLNDVNILLHVSEDHLSATVVSIPRDLVIPQPECTASDGSVSVATSATPLNGAYNRGGLACVVNTVEALTGLDIPYAAQMSFKAVVKMTDAVGGVPVCLTEAIQDSDSGLDLPAGESTISGRVALSFLRNRHGVGDGSDLSRISSQQVYMSSLVRTIKSSDTLTNPDRLYKLANVAASNVRLSTSLASVDTMISMAQTLRTVDLEQLAFVQYPAADNALYPGKVVPNTALADAVFAKIAADEPVILSDDSLGNGAQANPDATDAPEPTDSATADAGSDSSDDGSSDDASGDATSTPSASSDPTPDEALSAASGQMGSQQTCAG